MNILSLSAAGLNAAMSARRESATPIKPTPGHTVPTAGAKPAIDARTSGIDAQSVSLTPNKPAPFARELAKSVSVDARVEPTPHREAHIQPNYPKGPSARIERMAARAQERASVVAKLAPELDRLRETANGLEAIAAKNLISGLRRSAAEKGPYADLANDMMNQTLSEHLAKSASLGIGAMLYRQLSASLVRQSGPTPVKVDARS